MSALEISATAAQPESNAASANGIIIAGVAAEILSTPQPDPPDEVTLQDGSDEKARARRRRLDQVRSAAHAELTTNQRLRLALLRRTGVRTFVRRAGERIQRLKRLINTLDAQLNGTGPTSRNNTNPDWE
jgi:hypothetical protein